MGYEPHFLTEADAQDEASQKRQAREARVADDTPEDEHKIAARRGDVPKGRLNEDAFIAYAWDDIGLLLARCQELRTETLALQHQLAEVVEAHRYRLREQRRLMERMGKVLEAVQRQQDAEKQNRRRPCLFCYEATHVEDCPGPQVEAVVAKWREAKGAVVAEASGGDSV